MDTPDASARAHEYETVRVNLVPRSLRALEDAAAREGDTHTDTLNRALQVYNMVSLIQHEPWPARWYSMLRFAKLRLR